MYHVIHRSEMAVAKIQIKPGDKFGEWTVIREVETKEKRKHFEVQCKCGFLKVLRGIR